MIPELFGPEIIATGFYERDITISPDGTEIFYGLITDRHVTILNTRISDGKWTEPEIAPFARNSNYFFLEPCFSPDGRTIYFLSTKPPEGKEPKAGWTYQNIWASDKKNDGTWGEIYNPDTALNRLNSQFYPSLTKTGTIYFTRSDAKTGKSEILRARKKGNRFDTPEHLPPVINASGNIYNAFISPDESFLIGCIENKNNEINPGFSNYCIFFRDSNDNWSQGITFGPEINIKGSNAISASVSPDGKYLFFAASTTNKKMNEVSSKYTLGAIREYLNSPQNGNYDIYWVSTGVIDALRPK
ncbi:MAG: PD40 domain-containing protein [Bacteroidia bacterium]|nr:PD40 domain-containing protein [Bacteroidia bacterium]